MKYNLNDKPSILPFLLYGLQWWLVSIPSVIIIGAIVSQIHYTEPAEQIFYLQKLFAVIGIAVLAQVLWGHKLPLIIGPASVLLIGILASVSSGTAAIYTAVLIGGALIAILSATGLLSNIQFIFTPRIVTVILILIAFTLSPVIIRLVTEGDKNSYTDLLFAILLTLSLIICNRVLKGVWKSTTVLWGIIVGSVLYYAMYGLPDLSTGVSSLKAPTINFHLDLDPGTILAFVFCFITLIINELGSIQAVGQMLLADKMKQRTSRGIGVLGASNMVAGLMGVIGPVDYSMSPGVISATGCASRYTLIPAGIGLAICGFFPDMINFLIHIPGVVMGSVLLYLMSTQLAAGLQMLTREQAVTDFNSGIIIAVPLMVSILITFAPAETLNQIPSLLRPILGNGFVMGLIAVLLMELVIMRKKK